MIKLTLPAQLRAVRNVNFSILNYVYERQENLQTLNSETLVTSEKFPDQISIVFFEQRRYETSDMFHILKTYFIFWVSTLCTLV